MIGIDGKLAATLGWGRFKVAKLEILEIEAEVDKGPSVVGRLGIRRLYSVVGVDSVKESGQRECVFVLGRCRSCWRRFGGIRCVNGVEYG